MKDNSHINTYHDKSLLNLYSYPKFTGSLTVSLAGFPYLADNGPNCMNGNLYSLPKQCTQNNRGKINLIAT